MRKGDVWLINLDPTIGAEIKKTRPGVIVSEDAIGVLPLKVVRWLVSSAYHAIRIAALKASFVV
jgi:mRNA-degrading endonuclease toxin of MazEF toxin-antitoxin module